MIKKILYLILILAVVSSIAIVVCDRRIEANAAGKLFSTVQTVPYNRVGLLLGTGKFLRNGIINPYYSNRVMATTQLYEARKIKYILISGDNSEVGYDEPTDMRQDLISRGVDSSVIYLDYAGFRTFDSMKRLKEVFGQDSATVISQQFHNERAIYIAQRLGIHAIGFNAKDVSASAGFKTNVREKFARTKVFIDFWFGAEPKFLGPPVEIPQ